MTTPLLIVNNEINEEKWPTNFESYELAGKIGQGAFASVWKAHCLKSKSCAIKIIDLEKIDTNLVDIRQEVQMMRLSSHPNVLACYTSFVKGSELWLVMQLMEKGSSLHCIQRCKKNDLSLPEIECHITYILYETLLGLSYIHGNGQIHRDIKATNILLDCNSNVRIADFGVSGWLVNAGNRREHTETFVGTPCWMAPEVMEQIHGYDYKADVWSFGITALELAKGYAPYAKYAPMKVLLMTIQEPPPSLESYDEILPYTNSFQNMIKLCLQKDPKKRPNCEQLLLHKHFQGLKLDSNIYRETLQIHLQKFVKDVGGPISSEAQLQSNFPGTAPVYLLHNESRPAGTSWIFSDGSQVLASSLTGLSSIDEDNDKMISQTSTDFFDEFERQTRRCESSSLTPEQNLNEEKRLQELTHDNRIKRQIEKEELSEFFDEFEKTTGGENFKHQR